MRYRLWKKKENPFLITSILILTVFSAYGLLAIEIIVLLIIAYLVFGGYLV